jgi:hypothetical protein
MAVTQCAKPRGAGSESQQSAVFDNDKNYNVVMKIWSNDLSMIEAL